MAKKYYFVLSKDFYYCVPQRDLLTPGDVGIDDEISFKYNSLSLQGTVRFISSFENEVMAEIRKEQKMQKQKEKTERSFSEGRLRKSAMRQRQLMENVIPKAKPTVDESKDSDKRAKKKLKDKVRKEKDMKRSMAANAMEQAMLQVADSPDPFMDEEGSYPLEYDSGSSVEATTKKETTAKVKEDIRALKSFASDVSPGPSHRQDSECEISSEVTNALKRSVDKAVHQVKVESVNAVQDKNQSKVALIGSHDKAGHQLKEESVTAVKDKNQSEVALNGSDDKAVLQSKVEYVNAVKDKNQHVPEQSRRVIASDTESLSADDDQTKHGSERSSLKRSYSFCAGSASKKNKRSASSSSSIDSSSSTSESSSSSESESTSSSSDEDDSESSAGEKKKRRKTSRKYKKSKTARKGKKSRKRRNKGKSASKVARNMDIYPGENYNWKESQPGVERIHNDFPVYIPKTDLAEILKDVKSPQTFIKAATGKVFTLHCLKGSTAQGYPDRCKGSRKLKGKKVLPRVNPEGRRAIIKRAEDLESERKSWRPKIGKNAMSHAFTSAVGWYKDHS